MDVIKLVALWFVLGYTVAIIELMAEIACLHVHVYHYVLVGLIEVLTGHNISTVFVFNKI